MDDAIFNRGIFQLLALLNNICTHYTYNTAFSAFDTFAPFYHTLTGCRIRLYITNTSPTTPNAVEKLLLARAKDTFYWKRAVNHTSVP